MDANINLLLLDQMVQKTAQNLQDKLSADIGRRVSKAFVFLSVKALLDLDTEEEVLDCIYDGSNDFGIDGLYVSDIIDDAFHVTIFQCKYKTLLTDSGKEYNGLGNYPANEVQKMISVVKTIFDPNKTYLAHEALKAKIEEIRSIMLNEGIIPSIEVVLCNNGLPANQEGQTYIANANFPDYVGFKHFNHDDYVALARGRKKLDEYLKFDGYRIVEDFDRKRVFIGKVNVAEFYRIFEQHGDILLEKNIRKYLGTKTNKVNSSIAATLLDPQKNKDFFFMNNGITIVTSKITYNNLQEKDVRVDMKDMHIINGGQTCKTIHTVLSDNPGMDITQCYVLVRIYELDSNNDSIVSRITIATNSQTVVDLSDLKSNDEIQLNLHQSIPLLGQDENGKPLFVYQPKKGEKTLSGVNTPITMNVAAEAVLSVWRQKPNYARFHRNKLFGQFYEDIFGQLNAAQLVLAVLIWRQVENKRKHGYPQGYGKDVFIPYASNVISMLVGKALLAELDLPLPKLKPTNFDLAHEVLEKNKDSYYEQAIEQVHQSLKSIGVRVEADSLQRIAATFRRSDLITELNK